ncbi:MAG: ribonuclease E/G, partial [Proteobacteria bacterium]|nr:ribonuclease E/G [Pseudomonadota bacterium]
DVNSARATKGSDIEETALQTNLEAVDELARQMRIRDMGGLLVIDLIDMTSPKNKKTVENRLAEAVRPDRARIQIGHISRFGLLEMSRQRMRSSISDSNYGVCTLCDGTGQVRNVTSSALSILRILEEEALKENTEAVFAELPLEVSTFLLNEKRFEVNQIEARLGTRIVLIPSSNLHGSQNNIQRLKSEDLDSGENMLASHKIKITSENDTRPEYAMSRNSRRAAVSIDQIATTPPPAPAASPSPAPKKEKDAAGFFSRLFKRLGGDSENEAVEEKPRQNRQHSGNRSRGGRGGNRRDGGRSQNRNSGNGTRSRNASNRNQDRNKTEGSSEEKNGQRRSRGGRNRSSGQGNRQSGNRTRSPQTGQSSQSRDNASSASSGNSPKID